MTITIRLKTDNAAFEDDREGELLRIFGQAALAVVQYGASRKSLRDSNGNTVGSVTVTGH
jgi:hypothetical protein